MIWVIDDTIIIKWLVFFLENVDVYNISYTTEAAVDENKLRLPKMGVTINVFIHSSRLGLTGFNIAFNLLLH